MLDRLTLDQLRMLIAVAETGSFSAAARRLGRVQSAVSQSVQALEATLGLALFDRGERTPKLSDAGRALAPLKPAADAIVIDSTARDVAAVVDEMKTRALAVSRTP